VATNTSNVVVQNPRNGMGVAALVLGVLALVLAILVIFFPLAGLLGLIALILGAIGMSRASRGEATNRGQALAGLITGLIALVIAIALTAGVGSFFTSHVNDFRKLGTCMKNADTNAQMKVCTNTFSNNVTK
jgi:membrane-bound ClpP family serine protease